jgi:predicted DNA-binding transcriptional regulator AlpA
MTMSDLRISRFNDLPDSAWISAKELVILSGRSRTTLWRDVRSGSLEKPLKVGRISTRWTVAQVKAYLTGK